MFLRHGSRYIKARTCSLQPAYPLQHDTETVAKIDTATAEQPATQDEVPCHLGKISNCGTTSNTR